MKTFSLNEKSLNDIKCFTFDEWVVNERQKREGTKLNEELDESYDYGRRMNEQDEVNPEDKIGDNATNSKNLYAVAISMFKKLYGDCIDDSKSITSNSKLEDNYIMFKNETRLVLNSLDTGTTANEKYISNLKFKQFVSKCPFTLSYVGNKAKAVTGITGLLGQLFTQEVIVKGKGPNMKAIEYEKDTMVDLQVNNGMNAVAAAGGFDSYVDKGVKESANDISLNEADTILPEAKERKLSYDNFVNVFKSAQDYISKINDEKKLNNHSVKNQLFVSIFYNLGVFDKEQAAKSGEESIQSDNFPGFGGKFGKRLYALVNTSIQYAIDKQLSKVTKNTDMFDSDDAEFAKKKVYQMKDAIEGYLKENPDYQKKDAK